MRGSWSIGAAGTAAAILLAEGGVAVDLIDIKPRADAAGSGITLQGNALRVLRRLGVWDGAGPQVDLHSPGFWADERALPVAVRLLVHTALEALATPAG